MDGRYPRPGRPLLGATVRPWAGAILVPPRPVKAKALRVLIAAAACVLGVVVAIAVIGLRWHYFTDTLAGAAVGIGTVCGLALILDLSTARLWLTRVKRRLPGSSTSRGHEASA